MPDHPLAPDDYAEFVGNGILVPMDPVLVAQLRRDRDELVAALADCCDIMEGPCPDAELGFRQNTVKDYRALYRRIRGGG